MKQILSLIMLTCTYMLCGAQATFLTVDNKVAGTLSQRILYDDRLTVENLTITGEINADDLAYIKELNSKYKLKGIIDLSDVIIVSGGQYPYGNKFLSTVNNVFNTKLFSLIDCRKLVVPHSITTWRVDANIINDGSAGNKYGYPFLNADSLIIDCPNISSINNGIGNPSYLFVGEGIKSISIATRKSDDKYGIVAARDTMCIVLPSSLTSLSGHEDMGTPYMRIYSKILRPDKLSTDLKLADNVFAKGIVYAPNDAKEYYEASIFKNLEIISPTSVKSLYISTNGIIMKVGETEKLEVSVYPNNADNKNVLWMSSNESVAVVDANGAITAVGGGEAEIIVTSAENPEIKDYCIVTVIQPVTGISLNKSVTEIVEDESEQLFAIISPENATNKSVTWTSSDVSIAMVSSDGTVYGIKPGQATIMATTVDGGFVALCKVTVKAKTVVADAIQLSPNSATIAKGENLQLNVVLTPDNVSNKTVNWTSTNTNVATVDASGLVRAISEGKTQIIATTTDGSNLSAICEITVENQFISVTKIEINPTSERIAKGKSIMLNAVITPEDASLKTVSWSSTNPGVATVSQNGEVTAVSEGNAIVIASTQDGSNLSAMCQITVYDESGIETILSDKNSYVKVFNLSGCIVYEGIYNDAKLIPGFYIVMCDGKSYKIKI